MQPLTWQQSLDTAQRAFDAGRWSEAAAHLEPALQAQPDSFEANHLAGLLAYRRGSLREAVSRMTAAAAIRPQAAGPHANLANVYSALGDPARALQCIDAALALAPGLAAAHHNRAVFLLALARPDEALAGFDRAVELRPDYADAWDHRGNLLLEMERCQEALDSYRRALVAAPQHVDALHHLGVALRQSQDLAGAAQSVRQAIALRPGYADAHNTLGLICRDQRDYTGALASFDAALAARPAYAVALVNRASTHQTLGDFVRAASDLEHAYALEPGHPYLLGTLIHARMHNCDWRGLDELRAALARGIDVGDPVSPPFSVLGVLDSPPQLLKVARTWAGQWQAAGPIPARHREGRKLKLGYYSADLHAHATAILIAELFERHDRDRFELTAFSYGPRTGDPTQRRLISAFDHFHDVSGESPAAVIRASREAGIDIAVDLKGYTQNARAAIFAGRAAPVQTSFLGFPGSMGATFMDYLIADDVVVAESERAHFSESIAYLPGSYQVNDSTRPISTAPLSRAQAGLPEDGFVYCCFNSAYKYTPEVFACWMRILSRVDASVLWLLADSPAAQANLLQQAQMQGISPARLVFASRLPPPEHLARHRLADLFLDTLPCNAHTTASDALWAGLPVLTCAGRSFAARVAASLVQCAGLPGFVTRNLDEYEALAMALARDRAPLALARQTLDRGRAVPTGGLFDANRFAHCLEAAFESMHDRAVRGLPPADIRVTAPF